MRQYLEDLRSVKWELDTYCGGHWLPNAREEAKWLSDRFWEQVKKCEGFQPTFQEYRRRADLGEVDTSMHNLLVASHLLIYNFWLKLYAA